MSQAHSLYLSFYSSNYTAGTALSNMAIEQASVNQTFSFVNALFFVTFLGAMNITLKESYTSECSSYLSFLEYFSESPGTIKSRVCFSIFLFFFSFLKYGIAPLGEKTFLVVLSETVS